jgi:hypothetical protein
MNTEPNEQAAAAPPAEVDAVAALRARNTLIRTVRTRLRGAGLEVRELASDLVISHPRHPERGRIYIRYATGDVLNKRTIWDHLGRLDGYASTEPDAEPPVDTAAIVAALSDRHVRGTGQGQ